MLNNSKNMKNSFVYAVKGMIVGASMLIPGVSGGSMAIILGIYDKLISSISSFFKHKKESIMILGSFGIGAIIGLVLFASPLEYLTKTYNMIMMYFFIGAVAGGLPLMYKKANINKIDITSLLYIIFGAAITLLLNFIPEGLFVFNTKLGLAEILLLLAAGLIIAVALILPGISTSYMLLILGMYDETMRAIKELYFPYLIPIALGALIGIALTTRTLEKALESKGKATYLIIIGFILGSVIQVFPGIPEGLELIICPITFAAGYFIIRKISQFGN